MHAIKHSLIVKTTTIIVVLGSVSWASTQYVNQGQSIQSVLDTARPGDTVIVRDGIYRETVTFKNSGTAGNPIQLQADSNAHVVIDGGEPIMGWQACTSDDADLMVLGEINPFWQNIYWALIETEKLPTDPTRAVIFEDRNRCRIARTPDQTNNWGVDVEEFLFLEEEAWNHSDGSEKSPDPDAIPTSQNTVGVYSYIIDSDFLTQPEDYWNGAIIELFSHAMNNNLVRRTAADYIKQEHKLVFDQLLDYKIWYGSKPDSYSLLNHPHTLDSAGEFLIMPESGTHYKIYLWPTNPHNLSDAVSLAVRTNGIQAFQENYLVIDGFEVRSCRSEGILMKGRNDEHSQGITVRNCSVFDTGGTAIYLIWTDNSSIEGCTVDHSEGRGAFINGGKNGLIKDCLISNTASTNMSFYGMDHGLMIGNTVTGCIGAHGNGSSCYIDCKNILLANNTYINSNMAFNNLTNIVVYNNLFYGETTHNWSITPWSSWYDGYQVYMHNTVLGVMLLNPGQEQYWSTYYPAYYLMNNICCSGMLSWEGEYIA
ncbi:MAG: hypothetical protein GF384_00870, partial [Elusimicrobia bacterium]|nr:hypothetical protein [Elusimicrobiota bacterium]